MHKDVIRAIAEVDLFPVISFVIFFAFFLGLLVYVIRRDKKEMKHMAAMPLEDESSRAQLSDISTQINLN